MDIISWILTGIIVGALINLVTPTRFKVGFLGGIAMGALAATVFSFMCGIVGLLPEQQFSWEGVATAAIGAVGGHIVMLGFRKIARV